MRCGGSTGGCSDETLGMAQYTESEEVLLLTSLTSSDAISDAGDYVFRNYPSNYGQVNAWWSFCDQRTSEDSPC